jgi:hypothetical protein
MIIRQLLTPRTTDRIATTYTSEATRLHVTITQSSGYTALIDPMGPDTALLHDCVTHFPDFEETTPISIADTPDYRKLVQSLTARKQAQAKYLVGLEMLSEMNDDDSEAWIPESVIRHRIIMKPRKRLIVKVT